MPPGSDSRLKTDDKEELNSITHNGEDMMMMVIIVDENGGEEIIIVEEKEW